MSTIDTVHPDYALELKDWVKIEDITRRRNLHKYLLYLNPQDKSKDNEARNQQYRERAIFYAITSQTVSGMIGTMFRKFPNLSVPKTLEYVLRNIDGANTSIYQQSQGLCDDVIRKSRAGLYVAYPPVDGPISQADMIEGRYVATIHRFEPEQIINWRVVTENATTKLKFVVLEEYKEKPDQYTTDRYRTLRELYLDDDGIYKERHWSDLDGSLSVVDQVTPTDAQGNVWREIPFMFVGSENNDAKVDRSVMLPLVELNIGHYRNSADWEDSVWYCGQPQPWMSNVTEDHLQLMKQYGMYVGSREVLGVPDGGAFSFAAAPPNPLVRQAMQDKVEMMLALGARIIQPGGAARTATEIAGQREAQHSILSLIAQNTSEAYTQCLQWAGRYMGVSDNDMADIGYEINSDFVAVESSPQELQQMMAGFIQGTIPTTDYIAYMKKVGKFDAEKKTEDYVDLLTQATAIGAE